ncbi:MAG: hypothetical protein LBT05_01060 [Planctomycetaceae bacterium]|nr:hypothetical protein [Planctomycetaceae bacterium]
MTTPQIVITFDGRGSRQYLPGETLAGSYRFESIGGETIQAVEVDVLWFTEGKGTEDFGVHDHWRRSADAGDWIDPRRPGRFSTKLPRSPLSYHGIIVKVHWCVRVRVFLESGREIADELPFTFGNLPDVRTLKT